MLAFNSHLTQLLGPCNLPPLFAAGTYLSALSASVGNKVWLSTAEDRLIPNLFVALIGPPASGKTMCGEIFIKLGGGEEVRNNPDETHLVSALYYSNSITARYEGIFPTMVMQARLSALFDYPESYVEVSGRGRLSSEHPWANLLLLAQAHAFRTQLADGYAGFLSRLLPFCLPSEPGEQPTFPPAPFPSAQFPLFEGEMQVTPTAKRDLMRFYRYPSGAFNTPALQRFSLFITKLSMLMALSSERMTIESADVYEAYDILDVVERNYTACFNT